MATTTPPANSPLNDHSSPSTSNPTDTFHSRTPSPPTSKTHKPTPPQDADADAEPSDLPHLIRTQRTAGYRAGITSGRDDPATAQRGFDAGYSMGGHAGARVGWIVGCLEEIAQRARAEVGADGVEAEAGRLKEEAARARRELGVREVLKEGAKVLAAEGDGQGTEQEWVAKLETLARWQKRVEDLGREWGVDLRYPNDGAAARKHTGHER